MTSSANQAVQSILHPRSIAVIGASEKTLYGRGIIEYLKYFKFGGNLFPVNPNRDEIMGIKAYRSVKAIPEIADLAIIIVERKYVLNTLKECVESGIKASIIITAGFREADVEGKRLEDQIVAFARENEHRICGPNCAGLANIQDSTVMCLLREEGRELTRGSVGFVSQSGALMMALAGVARDRGIGLSYIVSTGNECDLEVCDFMKYMLEDPGTSIVTAFIEGFKGPAKFKEVADLALLKKKPILLLKVGKTELGKTAASSHTGHLTGSDVVYDGLFQQKAIIRVADTYDLFDFTKVFSYPKRPKGDGVLILTSSGGLGSLTADLCGDIGIKLPKIEGATLDELLGLKGLLTFDSLGNPADIRGQGMKILDKVIPPLMKDDKFSLILICLGFSTVGTGVAQEIVPTIIDLAKTSEKPIFVLWVGRRSNQGLGDRESGFDLLQKSGVPVFEKPTTCLRAIKALMNWTRFHGEWKEGSTISLPDLEISRQKVRGILEMNSGKLDEHDSKRMIAAYGIPITREGVATSMKEAKSIAEEIGYPVALKVVSEQISHKTESGGIALNILNGNELETAYQEILERAKKYNLTANIKGVLVQEMIKDGTEVILGISRDPQFGPVIMFGIGGIFVELFKDVSFRVPPISRFDAIEMIQEIKGYQVLLGMRGKKKADIESIIEIIMKLSNMALDLRDNLVELDINPLAVFEEGRGAKALDALAVMKSSI